MNFERNQENGAGERKSYRKCGVFCTCCERNMYLKTFEIMGWILDKKTPLVLANNHGNLKPIYDKFNLLFYLETSYVGLGYFCLQPHDCDSSSIES